MATRFYLYAATHPSKTTTAQAQEWQVTTYVSRNHTCKTTRSGDESETAYGTAADADATAKKVLFAQFISEFPLATDTINAESGWNELIQIKGKETDAGNNLFVLADWWLMNPDGTAYSNNLYGLLDNTELPTGTATNRGTNAIISADVTGCAGKYIVIDIGVSGDPAIGKTHNGSLIAGCVSSSNDLPANDTSQATYNCWVELYQTLAFARSITATTGTYATAGIASRLLRGKKIIAAAGTYAITGIHVTLTKGGAAARVLTVTTGVYAITGVASRLLCGREIRSVTGTYAITGIASVLKRSRIFSTTTGACVLAGVAAILKATRKIISGVGAYVLNGVAAKLEYGREFVIATGAYVITGVAAKLNRGLIFVLATGSYTLNGVASVLKVTRKLVSAVGIFAINGVASRLLYGRMVRTVAGAYTIGTPAAVLKRTRIFLTTTGAYVITGVHVILTRTGVYILLANVGQFTLSGVASILKVERKLKASASAFSITGIASKLLRGNRTITASGTFLIAGISGQLKTARKLSTTPGSFNVVGQSIEFSVTSGAVVGSIQLTQAGQNAAGVGAVSQPIIFYSGFGFRPKKIISGSIECEQDGNEVWAWGRVIRREIVGTLTSEQAIAKIEAYGEVLENPSIELIVALLDL